MINRIPNAELRRLNTVNDLSYQIWQSIDKLHEMDETRRWSFIYDLVDQYTKKIGDKTR